MKIVFFSESQINGKIPRDFPKIYIVNKHDCIEDYSLNDIKIENYNPYGKIKMNMRA